ncbi:MAG: hypothetical protein H6995_12960 [Pseudomonadales bacterium]|nr:hypothetical protein [Pseudomonadales bacterium]
MKAIHGGKAKSDKIDSEKIARLIKGGTFPLAYTYPPELRPVRDLMRRRRNLVRFRSELLAHIKITHHQYNADIFEKNINKKGNRQHVIELFTDPATKKNIQIDLELADHLHDEIVKLENVHRTSCQAVRCAHLLPPTNCPGYWASIGAHPDV